MSACGEECVSQLLLHKHKVCQILSLDVTQKQSSTLVTPTDCDIVNVIICDCE